MHLDLNEVAGIDHIADTRHFAQKTPVTLDASHDGVRAETALDLPQVALEHALPAVHQTDSITQPLYLLHLVGREDDGLAVAFQVEHHFFEHRGVDRIEAAER